MPIISTLGAATARAYGFEGRIANSIGTVTQSATASGVGSSGRGPAAAPGNQYAIGGGNAASVNFAPISTTYIASSTGGYQYAFSRAIAFISPYSSISDATLNSWGFAPTDVVRATDIFLTSGYATLDDFSQWGYAINENGQTNISTYTSQTGLVSISDPSSGRNYHSFSGSYAVPNPTENQLIFMYYYDNLGANSIGITTQCTGYTI